jgi:hypothetical protein
MVRGYSILTILICLGILACKKRDSSCFNTYGEPAVKEVPLDSVTQFRLYKNITYHVYQDTLQKIVIRAGSNIIDHIHVYDQNHYVSVVNKNKCNFLRDYDNKVEVDIHYAYPERFYCEVSDSLIFEDTIVGEYLHVEQVTGGGGVRLSCDVFRLVMISSHGVGHYTVSGRAEKADLRVETNGSGDTRNFTADKYLILQNSTGDLRLNADQAIVDITIRGTGNILYSGIPDSIRINRLGDGNFIKQ